MMEPSLYIKYLSRLNNLALQAEINYYENRLIAILDEAKKRKNFSFASRVKQFFWGKDKSVKG